MFRDLSNPFLCQGLLYFGLDWICSRSPRYATHLPMQQASRIKTSRSKNGPDLTEPLALLISRCVALLRSKEVIWSSRDLPLRPAGTP